MSLRSLACVLIVFWLLVSGGSTHATEVGQVALVEDITGEINNAIALPPVYLSKIACVFYQTHGDNYDALFIFTSIPQFIATNVQVGWTVQNSTKGIGREIFDETQTFCSAGRLRHAVKMGEIVQLPDDPDAPYTGIPFFPLTGIELMAHEFGHHWLAAAIFMKDGVKHCLTLGFEPSIEPTKGDCDGYHESDFNLHWSYYFNTSSLMYGSTITDLGSGKFEISYTDNPKYSPLDQYLMGLRYKQEVPPMFVVDVGGDLADAESATMPSRPPRTMSGARIDFTIDEVIRAEGPRLPPIDECHWTAAFIIVHAADTPPDAAMIARVEKYRHRWESYYRWATDNRGSFDTTLDNSGTVTCSPPSPPDAGAGDVATADGAVDLLPDGSNDGAADQPDAAGNATSESNSSGCSCQSASQIGRFDYLLAVCLLLVVFHSGYAKRDTHLKQRSEPCIARISIGR